jgi:hypothetical protein
MYRPAYIYPVEPRKEPNFSYRLLRAIYPAFRMLFPNQVIRADDLGRAIVEVVVRETRRAEARSSRTATFEPWSNRFTPQGGDPATGSQARKFLFEFKVCVCAGRRPLLAQGGHRGPSPDEDSPVYNMGWFYGTRKRNRLHR